jgi:hypothetical protein
MSSESTFVVNVKTRGGTIVTVRGDTYEALQENILAAIGGGIDKTVGALEEAIVGDPAVAYATAALGATVVPQAPTNSFAPVPPPSVQQTQSPSAPAPVCAHGPMIIRTAKSGPRAGKDFWACTAPMNAPDKCKIVNI